MKLLHVNLDALSGHAKTCAAKAINCKGYFFYSHLSLYNFKVTLVVVHRR